MYMQHKLRLDNESIPVIWNQFDVFSKSINKNENENHNVIVNQAQFTPTVRGKILRDKPSCFSKKNYHWQKKETFG